MLAPITFSASVMVASGYRFGLAISFTAAKKDSPPMVDCLFSGCGGRI